MGEIVVLSGGVGGARFVRGLVDLVGPTEVTVVGNVGDDTEVFGLHVSPDLDSLLYTLTDRHDEERGWGRRGETWNALDPAKELGDDETWFQLGDRDLGLHLVRTKALKAGEPLSAVTARIAEAFGLEARRGSARGRGAPRCSSGSSAEVTGTRWTGCASRAPRSHGRLPACSRRSSMRRSSGLLRGTPTPGGGRPLAREHATEP